MEEPTFWEDADKASKTMQELKGLKSVVGSCNELSSKYEDIQTSGDLPMSRLKWG